MLLFTAINLVLIPLSLINLTTSLFSFRRDKIHPKSGYRPKVTVISRTWDDDHIVGRFIDELLAQDYPKDKLQIIIADDASDDDTEKICERYGKKITYVRAKTHHHKKAVFLNKVIKDHANGDILINTDIDGVFPKNWVRNLVEHFADDKVQATCGPVYSGNYNMNWLTKIRTVEDFWLFSSGMWGRYNILGTSGTYGSNHAIRMDTLKKLGYYGTKTLTEDAELTAKVWKNKMKTAMCPEAYVLVEAVDDLGSFERERKRWIAGTIDTGLKYRSFDRTTISAELLTMTNLLTGPMTILGLVLMFFNWIFVWIVVANILITAISMISFKAKKGLLIWIPAYLIVYPFLNLWALLLAGKDKIFGGVKWTKVSGDKYHKGFELKPPLS